MIKFTNKYMNTIPIQDEDYMVVYKIKGLDLYYGLIDTISFKILAAILSVEFKNRIGEVTSEKLGNIYKNRCTNTERYDEDHWIRKYSDPDKNEIDFDDLAYNIFGKYHEIINVTFVNISLFDDIELKLRIPDSDYILIINPWSMCKDIETYIDKGIRVEKSFESFTISSSIRNIIDKINSKSALMSSEGYTTYIDGFYNYELRGRPIPNTRAVYNCQYSGDMTEKSIRALIDTRICSVDPDKLIKIEIEKLNFICYSYFENVYMKTNYINRLDGTFKNTILDIKHANNIALQYDTSNTILILDEVSEELYASDDTIVIILGSQLIDDHIIFEILNLHEVCVIVSNDNFRDIQILEDELKYLNSSDKPKLYTCNFYDKLIKDDPNAYTKSIDSFYEDYKDNAWLVDNVRKELSKLNGG